MTQAPSETIILDSREAVEGVLPHRRPFLFVDFVEVTPGESANGLWTPGSDVLYLGSSFVLGQDGSFTTNPEWGGYDGHFPGNRITPGVITLAALAGEGQVVAGADSVTWKKPILPGSSGIIKVKPNENDPQTIDGDVLIGDNIVAMTAQGVRLREQAENEVPPRLLLEFAAQVGALAVLTMAEDFTGKVLVFQKATNVTSHAPAIARQGLEAKLSGFNMLKARNGPLRGGRAIASVSGGGEVILSAQISFGILDATQGGQS